MSEAKHTPGPWAVRRAGDSAYYVESSVAIQPLYTAPPLQDQEQEQEAAVRTLASLGYTYHGGEQWKPPLGQWQEPVAAEEIRGLRDFADEYSRLFRHMDSGGDFFEFQAAEQKRREALETGKAARGTTADAPSAKPDGPLENLRERLLAPREIVRDANGFLTHPNMPLLDEDVRLDQFLAVFALDCSFVSIEDAPPEISGRYFNSDSPDCSYWTPTPPKGRGWVLLEIYDTEDGPVAIFVRPTQPDLKP